MLSLDCKNVQHVKIYKKVPQLKIKMAITPKWVMGFTSQLQGR
jgi:hypothetical protein